MIQTHLLVDLKYTLVSHGMQHHEVSQLVPSHIRRMSQYLINCKHVQLDRVHGGDEMLHGLCHDEHDIWPLRHPAGALSDGIVSLSLSTFMDVPST